MSRRHLLLTLALLGHAASAFSTEEAAQRFLLSQAGGGPGVLRDINILWGTEGDVDGDGIADYAAIVWGRTDQGAKEEERLLVLSGAADGTYKFLSQSGDFCGVGRNGKFYNLTIDKSSLFVEGVWADGSGQFSSRAMQFRYNRGLHDLQLIGEEEASRDETQSYKVSVNFLTGTAIYSRERGKRRKQVKVNFTKPPLPRLQDFVCFSQDGLKPKVDIDENFKVNRH